MKYCTIYLVRHGETEWNVKCLMQGHEDSPLTGEGIKQAKELAAKLKKIKFAAVFSSDLLRAKRTAEIITLEKKLAVKTTKLLRERSFGRFEGKTYQEYGNELKQMFEKVEELNEKQKLQFKPATNIESYEEIFKRLNLFLREVSIAYPGKNILVVAHGGVIKAFLIHLGFAKYQELPAGTIKNTAYVKLLSDGTDYFIKETFGIEKVEIKPH